MAHISLYFNIHDFFKLKTFRMYDIGNNDNYFDYEKSGLAFNEKANKIYLPLFNSLLDLAKVHEKELKIVFMITGVTFEHFTKYAPELIEKLEQLSKMCDVEYIAQPYYNSLSSLTSQEEFKRQIGQHSSFLEKHFKSIPNIIANTPSCVFCNNTAALSEDLGFKGILGCDKNLNKENTSNYKHSINGCEDISAVLFNYKLSSFIDSGNYEKVLEELKNIPIMSEDNEEQIVNLFLDVNSFNNENNKISNLKDFVEHILKDNNKKFVLPSEKFENKKNSQIDAQEYVSSSLGDKNLHEIFDNNMQKDAIKSLYRFERQVKETKDNKLINSWKKLTGLDYFKMMSTTHYKNGTVEKYVGDHETPYDTYINFMNVLEDMGIRIKQKEDKKAQEDILKQTRDTSINKVSAESN